jgi:hypothetical protein
MRRTPTRSSRPRIVWLNAEVDTSSRFAARVKLRSSATARNAERTLSSSRTICELYSQTFVDSTGYSGVRSAATLTSGRSEEVEAQAHFLQFFGIGERSCQVPQALSFIHPPSGKS